MALLFSSGNQNIQPPFPTFSIKRPEVHSELPVGIAPITDADENDVPFVSLHVLQILDEERLFWMISEKFFARIVLPPKHFQSVLDCLCLTCTKSRHTKR